MGSKVNKFMSRLCRFAFKVKLYVLPIMLRRTHNKWMGIEAEQHRLARERQRRRLEKQIKSLEQDNSRIKEPIKNIMERAAYIDFDRDKGTNIYRTIISFDARMFSGYRYGEELSLLAEQIARQVENEILSCRFVESSKNRERERMMQDPHGLFPKNDSIT